MKKYITPETKVFKTKLQLFVCVSPTREASWGNNDPDNQYSNKDWYNEGYRTPKEAIRDDWAGIDAQ